MKTKAVAASLSFVAMLAGTETPLRAQEPDSLQNPPLVAAAPADKEELLMFFEEHELVTATKRSIPLRHAPAIATVITADEIRNMGARNLLDLLKMVPGVGISINEFNAMMVEVRGIRTGTSEKILVMVDGHSMNRNTNGSAIYRAAEMFPIEMIKQVEVMRGPGSALYGNSAFVATINIITRNAAEINGLEVKGGGGSFDSYQGNLVGGIAHGDKLTVAGSVDRYQSVGARLTVPADNLTGTPYSQAPGQTDLSVRQTDAFLKAAYGDLSVRGHYINKHQGLNVGIVSAITDRTSRIQLDDFWGELSYNRTLPGNLTATGKFTYDFYGQDPNVKIYPDGFLGLFPEGMVGQPKLKNRTYGGELQVDWDVFKGNHLIWGVSLEEMKQYDVRQFANFNPLTGAPLPSVQEVANWNKEAKREIYATYLQDEWQLPAGVNLTAGLRYDHYSDFGHSINPRAAMVWRVLDNTDLKLLYGQAFRAPNFQELYNINNPVVVGNPDLKPERIRTYEAALSWRPSRSLAANANYFYSTITDQIGWVPSTVPGSPAVNSNLGKSKTRGIELGLNGDLSADLSWRLNYAYQDARDAGTDRRLPYVPSQRGSGSVNYAASKYLNLHGDLLWTGPRPRPRTDSRRRMPSYSTVDVAATLKNFYRTLEIQATVRNLFDKRYADPDTSGGALNLAGTAPKVPGDFPREGISTFLTATYKF